MPDELQDEFVKWVGRQPSSEEYNYFSKFECPLGRFLNTKDFKDARVSGTRYWTDFDNVEQFFVIPFYISKALCYDVFERPRKRTYGEFYQILRKGEDAWKLLG